MGGPANPTCNGCSISAPRRVDVERRKALAGLARRAADRAGRGARPRPGPERWRTTGSARASSTAPISAGRHEPPRSSAPTSTRRSCPTRGSGNATAASGRAGPATEIDAEWPGMRDAWRRGELTAPPGGEDDAKVLDAVRRRDDARARARRNRHPAASSRTTACCASSRPAPASTCTR